MKRTAMQQHMQLKRPMPAKEPKVRMRKCALSSCRALFAPRSMTHKYCSTDCAVEYAVAERERHLKSERRAGLEKLKTRRDYMKLAQAAFNAWVRERDKDKPCICCGRKFENDMLRGHSWDCGHYRSVGSAPHMRFVENNAHRQLVVCNRNGAGRAVDYRIGLIARIGLAAVESIECDQTPRKWSIDELKDIAAHYREKLRELKKEQPNG